MPCREESHHEMPRQEMTHRERVFAALRREIPDRCPMQISFTPEFAHRLTGHLGLTGRREDRVLERALDVDLVLTSVGWLTSYYQERESYVDEWGVRWRSSEYETRYGTGRYTEIVGHPLEDDEALDAYTAPDPRRDALYEEARRTIETYRGEYCVVGVTKTTVFECAWALRGLERLLMDFVLDPDIAKRILDIPFRYHLAAAERLVRMGVDMIWIGDDVGSQKAMLISPQTWRIYLKPLMARFIRTIKSINPDLLVVYHSDGMIMPIIEDLIEIGLDVLNPVQPACMDPAALKDAFGDRLCFWGSVDQQSTLPFGTPEIIAGEVLLRLQTIGRGGGLIIGPTHNVQLDTPVENLMAMVETVRNTPYPAFGGRTG